MRTEYLLLGTHNVLLAAALATAVIALACDKAPVATPTSIPATPAPFGTSLLPDVTPTGILSNDQAKAEAIKALSIAAPELNVVQVSRNAVVRLLVWGDYLRLYEDGTDVSPQNAPYDQLVWFVEAEGEWRSGGIVPAGSYTTYNYGSVAMNAADGKLMRRSHYNEPKLIGK